ncbi:2 3-bisphosphoglycerate-independent phosphoglycerate mutase [Bienertia sinuspersici]
MRALHNRVLTKDSTWKLAGFIIDDPVIDTRAIRDVFECSVLISMWRVRHAWHKAFMKRCSQNEMRIRISERLGQVVSKICTGQGDTTLFDDFMVDFMDNSEFVEYFKAVWYPRIGYWTTSLQTLPLASQEMNATIEFYHRQMNVRVLNEKDPSVYQRIDWLVDKLATKVHSYFWFDEYPAKQDFSRYRRDEWMDGLTTWRSSFNIPDSDVILEGQCAKVIDQQHQGKFFSVLNPGSEFSICDCSLSERGNLCEHVCKVNRVYRKKESSKPSLSLYQYKQALIKMLCCTRHDSLIRDHAVSLTSFLQKQLNALADFDSNERMISENELQEGFPLPSDKDISRNVSNANGRLCTDSELFDEMEIDPSSICVSPSHLFAMHGVLPADILSVNWDKTLLPDPDVMNGNGTSKDCDISDQVYPKDIITEEPVSLDIPHSSETHDPCSVINQDCDGYSDKVTETVESDDDNIALKFYRKSKTSLTGARRAAKRHKSTDKHDGRKDSKRDHGKAAETGSSSNRCFRHENGGKSSDKSGSEALASSKMAEAEMEH